MLTVLKMFEMWRKVIFNYEFFLQAFIFNELDERRNYTKKLHPKGLSWLL